MKVKKIVIILLSIVLFISLAFFITTYFENFNEMKKMKKTITDLNSKNTKLNEELKENAEKITYLETENKTLKNMTKEQLSNLKKAEEKVESLKQELNDTKESIKNRITLVNYLWDKQDSHFIGNFYFDDLSNVEKIKITYKHMDLIANLTDESGKNEIYLSLNKDENKANVKTFFPSFIEYLNYENPNNVSIRPENADLEIYYKDGRTETIYVYVGL